MTRAPTRPAPAVARPARRPDAEPAPVPGLNYYRLTARQFEKMIEADVFPEGAHVELIGGLLVDKMTKHQPHSIAVGQLRDLLARLVPGGWYVDDEKAVGLGPFDRPEPDVTVVRGQRRDYPKRPPGPKNLALVVEVSDTSYAKDRQDKWWRYAAARVPLYWIVNIQARVIEVYSDPAGRGAKAKYRSVAVFGEDAAVSVVIAGREVGRIPVRDVLP